MEFKGILPTSFDKDGALISQPGLDCKARRQYALVLPGKTHDHEPDRGLAGGLDRQGGVGCRKDGLMYH